VQAHIGYVSENFLALAVIGIWAAVRVLAHDRSGGS
jgi:hypothetical protein